MTHSSVIFDGCTFTADEPTQFTVSLWEDEVVVVKDCVFTNTTLCIYARLWKPESKAVVDVSGCKFHGESSYLSMTYDRRWREIEEYAYNPTGMVTNNIFIGETCGIVADYFYFDSILGNNRFLDGSGLHATYIVAVPLVGEEEEREIYGGVAALTTLPLMAMPYMDDDPWSSNYRRSFFHILEVTKDPEMALQPTNVDFVFKKEGASDIHIIWFGQVSTISENPRQEIPEWDDLDRLMDDLRIQLIEVGFWDQ